jgi:hypothetical protein
LEPQQCIGKMRQYTDCVGSIVVEVHPLPDGFDRACHGVTHVSVLSIFLFYVVTALLLPAGPDLSETPIFSRVNQFKAPIDQLFTNLRVHGNRAGFPKHIFGNFVSRDEQPS